MEIILILFLLFVSIMLWLQNRRLLSQLEELDKIRDNLEAEIDELRYPEKIGKLELDGLFPHIIK